jgi:hypothetical protein
MSDTFAPGVAGFEYPGGLDIDGVTYMVDASISAPYSAGSDTLHDVVITIPGLAPWAADRILRAVSLVYDRNTVEAVG